MRGVAFLALTCAALGFKLQRPADVADGNPFDVEAYYVNPAYQAELTTSISTASGDVKATLESMMEVPSAYWIDRKDKITGNGTDSLEGILADAASQSTSPLCVFIVYDLPNRDCHAKASNGEICCTTNEDGTCDYDAAGDCADGLADYQNNYIDPYASVLSKYDGLVPVVLIIEPDSLPNLATNVGDAHCGNTATVTAYKTGIEYAVKTIAEACSSCTLYVDAAHGGWLGWEDNLATFASDVANMGISSYIRGFSTNVANYQTIGTMCPSSTDCIQGPGQDNPCCSDPCGLLGQYNRGNNEMNFAHMLYNAMQTAIGSSFVPHMIIDSGRNGVDDMRSDCSDWCNIRGAGVGLLPTMKTGNTSFVDAFYWLKTPGESDGCTETLPSSDDPFTGNVTCARYDSMCGSSDSIGTGSGEPYAPEAGQWFDYQIKQLALYANMGSTDDDYSPPVADDDDDAAPVADDDDGVPASNHCSADNDCNTCFSCCKDYLSDQDSCDGCVSEMC